MNHRLSGLLLLSSLCRATARNPAQSPVRARARAEPHATGKTDLAPEEIIGQFSAKDTITYEDYKPFGSKTKIRFGTLPAKPSEP